MPRKIRLWGWLIVLAGAAIGGGCHNGAPKSASSRDEDRVDDAFRFHQSIADPAFGR